MRVWNDQEMKDAEAEEAKGEQDNKLVLPTLWQIHQVNKDNQHLKGLPLNQIEYK